jgi:hypothetical protein
VLHVYTSAMSYVEEGSGDTPDIDAIRKAIEEQCRVLECDLIYAFTLAENAPRVLLPLTSFIQALVAEMPAAVYWTEDYFDVDDFIETELLGLGWKPGWENHQDTLWLGPEQLKIALATKLEELQTKRDAPFQFAAMFPYAGMSYATRRIRAAWAIDLAASIEKLVEARKDNVNTGNRISDSEDAALLQSLVDELVASSVFSGTRGLNKRVLIAKKLLGERMPRHPLGRVGRIAQNSEGADLNLVMIVRAADEKLWLNDTVPD